MTKKIVFPFIAVAVLIGGGILASEFMNKNNDLNQRVLDNLEAMSNDESIGGCGDWCRNDWNYDCLLLANGVPIGVCYRMRPNGDPYP